jgi:F0F1-type ATP synthase assembly protein I
MRTRFDPGLIRQAGLLTAIPFVLLVGPALGYYLGSALDHRWAHAPWGGIIGSVLGLIASGKTTADLIKQAQAFTKHDDDNAPPR